MTGNLPYPAAAFAQKPSVSVVVGCFNQVDFVETAIRSVAQQSYRHLECVVVDDASTDGSQQRIRASIAELADERIRFLDRPVNGGQMSNMLQGLDATQSPFVAFLDADDVWNGDFVERHVAAHLSREGLAAVSTSDAIVIDDAGTVLAGGLPIFREGDPDRKQANARLSHVTGSGDDTLVFVGRQATGWLWSTTSGMMFRRDAIEAMRPDTPELIRHCADAYLAPAAHMLGGTVRLERVLGSYRLHKNNGWAHSRLLGDNCQTGATSADTDARIRALIANQFCAAAPHLEQIIPRRVMARTLVNHFGWSAAFDLVDSNPDAQRLLASWARPSRKKLFRLSKILPRWARPRFLK